MLLTLITDAGFPAWLIGVIVVAVLAVIVIVVIIVVCIMKKTKGERYVQSCNSQVINWQIKSMSTLFLSDKQSLIFQPKNHSVNSHLQYISFEQLFDITGHVITVIQFFTAVVYDRFSN